MKIRIHEGGVAVDDRLRAHLERRLDFALSSFGDRVERILVRLSHARPGGGGNAGKSCEIEVVLRPRSVRVSDSGTDLFLAVENAAGRLTRSVARALEREQSWAPGAPLGPGTKRRN